MRHIFTTILIVLSLSAIAQTKDCKIPTSVLVFDHPMLEEDVETHMAIQFRNLLDNYGFSTKIRNTRLAICLNPIYRNEHGNAGDARLDLVVSLYDTENENVLYSVKLDTAYYGDYFNEAAYKISKDFRSSIPQLLRVLDTIRANLLEIHEDYAQSWIVSSLKCVSEGNYKMSMFYLAQYAHCGAKYPEVRKYIVDSFRDFVNNDHSDLLYQAKRAWKNQESATDARFVIALLNSQSLTDKERGKAEDILSKVAKKYPDLDITAKEDYTSLPELMEVAVRLANRIGIEYGSMNVPETQNYIPLT